MTGGSLCTGYGGLDLAAHTLLPDLELRWVSEIDKDAAAVLAARHPDVPNIGDLTVADPEPVDVLTAGFPCQPVSQAGRRKGIDDERWLWDDIADLVGRMGSPPRMLLLENVPGLLTANGGDAMARVVHRLAEFGYVGRWRTLRAADVGACHRRARVFIVATLADTGGLVAAQTDHQPGGAGEGRLLPTPSAWLGARPAHSDLTGTSGRYLAPGRRSVELVDVIGALLPTPTANQNKGPGHQGRDGGLNLQAAVALLPTPMAADAKSVRNETASRGPGFRPSNGRTLTDIRELSAWGDYAAAIARHADTTGTEPPLPAVGERLNPVFVEWMMMLPAGWVTDAGISHTAQLRVLGNGVVPPQAAAAYTSLLGGCA